MLYATAIIFHSSFPTEKQQVARALLQKALGSTHSIYSWLAPKPNMRCS